MAEDFVCSYLVITAQDHLAMRCAMKEKLDGHVAFNCAARLHPNVVLSESLTCMV